MSCPTSKVSAHAITLTDTTPVKLVDARSSRRKLLVTVRANAVFFGDASVTATNGWRPAVDNFELETTAEIWVALESGETSMTMTVMDLFD